MSQQSWCHAFYRKWVTSQELQEICVRSYLLSLLLEKSITYKHKSIDLFNLKETLGQVNRFLEDTFQHKYQGFCPFGRNEQGGPEDGKWVTWDWTDP